MRNENVAEPLRSAVNAFSEPNNVGDVYVKTDSDGYSWLRVITQTDGTYIDLMFARDWNNPDNIHVHSIGLNNGSSRAAGYMRLGNLNGKFAAPVALGILESTSTGRGDIPKLEPITSRCAPLTAPEFQKDKEDNHD